MQFLLTLLVPMPIPVDSSDGIYTGRTPMLMTVVLMCCKLVISETAGLQCNRRTPRDEVVTKFVRWNKIRALSDRSSGSSTEHARACRDPLKRSFTDTNRPKEESPGGDFEAPVTERSSGKDD